MTRPVYGCAGHLHFEPACFSCHRDERNRRLINLAANFATLSELWRGVHRTQRTSRSVRVNTYKVLWCEHPGCTEPAAVEVEHYACGVRVATTRSCAAHRYHCRQASVVLSHVERAL